MTLHCIGRLLTPFWPSGLSAPLAWQRASSRVAATYRQLQQTLLAERAADVEDLCQQVLAELGVGAALRLDLPPEPCILALPTLLPSEVAALDSHRVRRDHCRGDRHDQPRRDPAARGRYSSDHRGAADGVARPRHRGL